MIKIKNNINTELTISHRDNQPAKTLYTDEMAMAVNTVTDMEAITTPADGDTVIVKDLNRGGTFVYDSSKVSEDNQGTNFNGWIRLYDSAVNVKWFGVSLTVSDNKLALESIFNSFRDVDISGGLYTTSSIEVSSDVNIRSIDGSGLRLLSTTTTRLFGVNTNNIPTTNTIINIDGLVFDGGYDGNNGITATNNNQHVHILSLNGVSNSSVKNCVFNNIRGDGIYLGSTENDSLTTHNNNIVISGNTFNGNEDNRNGISIITGTKVIIEKNIFNNMSHPSMPGCIDLEPNNDSSIINDITINNNAFNNRTGQSDIIVYFNSTLTHTAESISITNNKFRDTTTGVPVHIFNDTTAEDKSAYFISGNSFNNTFDGIVTRNTNGALITSNTFYDISNEAAIKVGYGASMLSKNTAILNNIINKTTNYGIMLYETDGVTITGNLINSSTKYTLYLATTINSNIKVTNNTITDTLGISTNGYVGGVTLPTVSNASIEITSNIVETTYKNEVPCFVQDDCTKPNSFSASSLTSVFPNGISTSNINGTNADNPDSLTQGILITNKSGYNGTIGWCFQQFIPRGIDGGNNTQQIMYFRQSNNLGNFLPWTKLYGESSQFISMKSLPTADPLVIGQLWNNTGVVTVSAG